MNRDVKKFPAMQPHGGKSSAVAGTDGGTPDALLKGSDIARILGLGIRVHQQGQFASAQAAYVRVLELDPTQADALHLLGLLAHQMGDHRKGVELIESAIRHNERASFYHSNLGECWRALNEGEKANACYRRALELDSQNADAHANLGTSLRSQGDPGGAIRHYHRSLELRPNDARNLANLGGAYCELGRFAEAMQYSREAVRLNPALFEAWINLGVVLRNVGRTREAIEALQQSLRLKAYHAYALNELAIALRQAGRRDESARVSQMIIGKYPSDAMAYLNLGNIWRDLCSFEKAEQCFAKALELRPDLADAWNNLGLVAKQKGLLVLAVERLQQSLKLNPASAEAWTNLGVARQRMAAIDDALECYRKAVQFRTIRDAAGSNMLYALQFHSGTTPQEICAEALKWGDALVTSVASRMPASCAAARPRERLRIGYISADFRAHPVGYFMSGLMAHHNRNTFETFCYSDVDVEDDWTSRFKSAADHYLPVRALADDELAERLAEDDLDLLVDLAGHTAKHRLRVFALRPCRCQATYLGYPGSTGLRTVDFRISDAVADPPALSADHYVERLMLIDRCAWCYEPPLVLPHASDPPCVQQGRVTFGCFNNYAKISPELLTTWSKLLRTVGDARLLLKADAFNEEEFVRETRRRFLQYGIEPDRLVLEGRTATFADHLRRYDAVDIALDAFPYHGTTTTCDALWMGVPVVTWRGDRHSSRVGASLLAAVGLADLVCESGDDYIQKAAALASNREKLRELRASLRETMARSELMDPVGFSRSFEAAILRMLGAVQS